MTEIDTCEGGGERRSESVPNVFCPACAFRQALMWDANADKPGTQFPQPGDCVEDYEILEKVGGNMGLIFKARHRLLDKIVAVKWVGGCTPEPMRLARFEREIRAMGSVSHPNLITAFDARNLPSGWMVAMEWIEGLNLQRVVRDGGPLPVDMACEIIRQAALGLHDAHKQGLVHRDVKPSNLMVSFDGAVKVIDLGIALAQEDAAAQSAERTGGTLSFCAPEQFQRASPVDHRADIYGLGCTLYFLLTGEPPYSGCKTFAELAAAHTDGPFPSLTASRADTPPTLDDVLVRMTAKRAPDRFDDAIAVAQALEGFAHGAKLRQLFASASARR